jgi:suppressor of G2 allele of SKP1
MTAIRHDYFQTDAAVTVSIYIKNISASSVSVSFTPSSASVSIPLPSGSEYILDLDPLNADIDPTASSYEVLSTQVQLKLVKKVVGLKWTDLEGRSESVVPSVLNSTMEKPPSYPTSSKKKPDWTAVEKSLESTDANSGGGDAALNAMFQQIYANASEETKRAMMKSYSESNGTCLSTNWDEVGKKKVDVNPPDGMIAKKFEM